MKEIQFVDVNKSKISSDIEVIFPDWGKGKEKICVLSPHDDDAIIGAGYAIEAALRNNAEVFIFIFCKGNAGYSAIEQKENIEAIRELETINAYTKLGIRKENIVRFNYSDFSVLQNIGWILSTKEEGSFKQIVTKLRELKVTRVVVPNHYREHIDHTAVSIIGTYDSPQCGDPILVDWAQPFSIKNVLEYSVWGDLDPEDALVKNRKSNLRANKLVIVSEDIERNIRQCISEYKSQEKIVSDLMASRDERKTNNNIFIEVYLSYDARPRLNYRPYIDFLEEFISG